MIGQIEARLDNEITTRNINKDNLAKRPEESQLYKKEVTENNNNAHIFDNKLSEAASQISEVLGKTENLNYQKTSGFLSSAMGRASARFYQRIYSELDRASKETFDKFHEQYEKNDKSIDKSITFIQKNIKEYNKLTEEIKGIEQTIYHKERMAADTSSLKARKTQCENSQKFILKVCSKYLKQIHSSNEQNKILLDKGLSK